MQCKMQCGALAAAAVGAGAMALCAAASIVRAVPRLHAGLCAAEECMAAAVGLTDDTLDSLALLEGMENFAQSSSVVLLLHDPKRDLQRTTVVLEF